MPAIEVVNFLSAELNMEPVDLESVDPAEEIISLVSATSGPENTKFFPFPPMERK